MPANRRAPIPGRDHADGHMPLRSCRSRPSIRVLPTLLVRLQEKDTRAYEIGHQLAPESARPGVEPATFAVAGPTP